MARKVSPPARDTLPTRRELILSVPRPRLFPQRGGTSFLRHDSSYLGQFAKLA